MADVLGYTPLRNSAQDFSLEPINKDKDQTTAVATFPQTTRSVKDTEVESKKVPNEEKEALINRKPEELKKESDTVEIDTAIESAKSELGSKCGDYDPDSKLTKAEIDTANQSLKNMTQDDVNNLNTILSDIVKSTSGTSDQSYQGNMHDADLLLKKTAEDGLKLLESFSAESGTMTCKPCSLSRGMKTSAEIFIFTTAYISAVINLTAFVANSYDTEGEINSTVISAALRAFFAAGSSGFMYLQGTVNIVEQVDEWNMSRNAKKESFSKATTDSIKNFISGFTTPSGFTKRVIFSTITAFSVLLDAKNTRFGIEKVTGSPIAGKIMGVLNGFSEALVPLTQLEKVWQCIFFPGTGMIRGHMFTEDQLNSECKSLLLANGGKDQFTKDEWIKAIYSMTDKEREAYKTQCQRVAGNTDRVLSEMSRLVTHQSIKSASSRVHGAFLFGLQSTAIVLTGLFVSAVMSVPEKYGYYSGELDWCLEGILEIIKENTLGNGTIVNFQNLTTNLTEALESMGLYDQVSLMFNGNTSNVDIDGIKDNLSKVCSTIGFPMAEFSHLQNALNITSYFLIAPALYMCFRNSFVAMKNLGYMPIAYAKDGTPPSKTDILTNIVAMGTSFSYATIIFGVKAAIDFVTGVEEDFNFNTDLIPQNDFTLWMAIVAVILTLYGGAQMGLTSVINYAKQTHITDRSIESTSPKLKAIESGSSGKIAFDELKGSQEDLDHIHQMA